MDIHELSAMHARPGHGAEKKKLLEDLKILLICTEHTCIARAACRAGGGTLSEEDEKKEAGWQAEIAMIQMRLARILSKKKGS